MISDYFKKYSNYYLSRYTVTKKKFEDILKKKITKDFFEKKISKIEYEKSKSEMIEVIKHFEKIGFFNEKNMLENLFQSCVEKGFSKKKIRYKIFLAQFDNETASTFLTNKFNEENLNELLLRNYLNKSKIIEKQKKLSLTETQLFDKVLSKLIQQGFDYEDSTKILKKIISHGNI